MNRFDAHFPLASQYIRNVERVTITDPQLVRSCERRYGKDKHFDIMLFNGSLVRYEKTANLSLKPKQWHKK